MADKAITHFPELLDKNHAEILKEWLALQTRALGDTTVQVEVASQSKQFIELLKRGTATGQIDNVMGREWADMRGLLEEVSRTAAVRGLTPAQTAMFVFSIKEPIFNLLRREYTKDADTLSHEVWVSTLLLDKLGLYTTEAYQKAREEVIIRQQEELLELSTPVVRLWDGILALPLIGTLDSSRTQVVMESLLQEIVNTGAQIAIIDITGVPTVDTLVAQHLLKTISAARLMGADCLISGIRPQIAQTIVHLGVELDVISKATMADAFAVALRRIGKTVTDRKKLEANVGNHMSSAKEE
jgi:rsbT co-antagonist protein RsbR